MSHIAKEGHNQIQVQGLRSKKYKVTACKTLQFKIPNIYFWLSLMSYCLRPSSGPNFTFPDRMSCFTLHVSSIIFNPGGKRMEAWVNVAVLTKLHYCKNWKACYSTYRYLKLHQQQNQRKRQHSSSHTLSVMEVWGENTRPRFHQNQKQKELTNYHLNEAGNAKRVCTSLPSGQELL